MKRAVISLSLLPTSGHRLRHRERITKGGLKIKGVLARLRSTFDNGEFPFPFHAQSPLQTPDTPSPDRVSADICRLFVKIFWLAVNYDKHRFRQIHTGAIPNEIGVHNKSISCHFLEHSEMADKMIRSLETLLCEERLKRLGLFSAERR